MIKFEVGEIAGRIWHYLKKNGPTPLVTLKEKVLEGVKTEGANIKFFTGLGWLMKENKLNISEVKNGKEYSMIISLSEWE